MKTIVQCLWHVCLWWWYHVMRAPSHCTVQSVASVTTYNNVSHFLVTVHTWSDLTNSKLQPMLKWSVHILLCVNANINLGVCIWVMRGDLIPTVVVTASVGAQYVTSNAPVCCGCGQCQGETLVMDTTTWRQHSALGQMCPSDRTYGHTGALFVRILVTQKTSLLFCLLQVH